MTERPVLFKGEMVLRVLDDSKTQTRRVPTSANTLVNGNRVSPKTWKAIGFDWRRAKCVDGPCILVPEKGKLKRLRLSPVWEVGDELWVRETWSPMWGEDCDNCDDEPELLDAHGHCEHFHVEYKADTGNKRPGDWPDPEPDGDYADAPAWKASIHMPRWASRIDLKVLSVRVERVQEISTSDAWAEGIGALEEVKQNAARQAAADGRGEVDGRDYFRNLWDSINAKRGYGWDVNPWVWVVEFKRIKP